MLPKLILHNYTNNFLIFPRGKVYAISYSYSEILPKPDTQNAVLVLN